MSVTDVDRSLNPEVPHAPIRAMLRRWLAGAALTALFGMTAATPLVTPVSQPSASPAVASSAPSLVPAAPALVSDLPSLAPSPPPLPTPISVIQTYGGSFETPTVAETQAWARAYLGPAEYAAADRIFWNESRWKPDAVNPRSGACGLGQSDPCSNLSSVLPDWAAQPIEQLRLFFIPYAQRRYGSFRNAWAYWCAHGRW